MDHVLFPRFWKEEPALWFAQVEAVFALNNITSDKAKYDYILCELPSTVISLVKDLVLESTTEFEDGKYQKIKKELVKRISIAELEKQNIGTMKPSAFYKYLKEKADPRISENILKEIWLKKLPLPVNYVVCDLKGCDIESACKLADTVKEYIPVQCLINKTEVMNATADENKSLEFLGNQFDKIYEELLKFKMRYSENTSHLERIQAELCKFKLAYKENYARLDNIEVELQQIRSVFLNQNNNNQSFCNICTKENSNQKSKDLDKTDHNSENEKSSITSEGEELDNDTENIETVTDEKAEKSETEIKLCWYHAIHGANAHNCLSPCSYKNKLSTGIN